MQTKQQDSSPLKAVVISLLIAIIALVLFILPAEYNIDPTGVGKQLGLTVFNDKTTVSDEKSEKIASKKDAVVVTVPAGKGIEYKLAMQQFEKVTYQWQTNGDDVYVDLHGEPKGDTSGYFESYAIAELAKMKGSFTAPFTGSHGWYWKNQTSADIQIELNFDGEYVIQGLK
jgi:hypothetical protein